MATKELGITATADIEDAVSGLQELIVILGQIPGTYAPTIEVDPTALQEAESNATALGNALDDIVPSAQEAGVSINTLTAEIDNIDDKIVDIVVDVEDEELHTFYDELDALLDETYPVDVDVNVHDEEIWTFADELNALVDEVYSVDIEVDSAPLEQAAESATYMGVNIAEAASAANELKDNMTGVGNESTNAGASFGDLSGIIGTFGGTTSGASGEVGGLMGSMDELLGVSELLGPKIMAVVAAIGALVIAAVEAVPAAGEFADSWSRLGEAVGMGGMAMEDVEASWGDAINTMKEETGRSAGIIREHIIQMGLAGITSKDLVIDSFRGISGAAFVTGQDIATIDNAFKRMVTTGVLARRQLVQLGITDNDVMKATGMTLDQVTEKFKTMDANGRVALLNQILLAKYGETANEAYKNSWQHVGDAMGAAWKGLEIAIGQFILPIAIPVMNALTAAVNGLAWALNTVRGYFDSLNISLGTVFKTLGALSLLIPVIGPFLAAMNLTLGYVIDNWNFLTESMGRFFALIQQGDWAGAIQILIAIFIDAFTEIGTFIFNFFVFTLPGLIGQASGTFLDIGVQMIQWIITGLLSISGWLADTLLNMFVGAGTQAGAAGGQGTINGFAQWLKDNSPKIAQIISDLLFKVLPELIKIAGLVVAIVLKSVFDSIAGWAGGLPRSMYQWGKDAFDSFTDAIIDSIPGLRWALDQVKLLFPQSPPKTGPLSDITEAGMRNWMSSIMDAGMDAAASFNLNNINPVPSIAGATSGGFSTGGIQVNVSLEGAVINSELDAEKVGQTIGRNTGDAHAARLKQQANNRGFNTINNMRR